MQRRTFLKATGAAVGMQVIPLRGVAQDQANRKVRLAAIGTGGQARGDLNQMADEEFVAFCDVNDHSLGWVREKYPNAKLYKDFRKMLAEVHDQIDAVTVVTPDHVHHAAVMEAMKYNKHVFCEKPLAHAVAEGREMMAVAAQKNLITQLGNQGHSEEGVRLMKEWVAAGAVGKPKELHAWCYDFPQFYYRSLDLLEQRPEVPGHLDWALWQGPLPKRAYLPDCVPEKWRGWMPYGNGVFADWVCHVLDGTFWALELSMPVALTAEVDANYDPKRDAMIYPKGTRVTMEFVLKDGAPFKITWYDGNMKVPRPADLEQDRDFDNKHTGAYLVGDGGTLLHGSHGSSGIRLIPESKMQAFKRPERTIPRVSGGNCKDWLSAVRAGKHTNCAPFSYGGRLSEIGLLGTIALRFPGQRLTYDEKAMRFTNSDDANKHLLPERA
ncbi:MAG: Gfo/Idh/MocA family oxidoreductase [Kiritimatiellaeota bacterium]|nr:Gfo/Idh/MocA family oxidoreductase [Kiritimatiellota bacterium]